MKWLDELAFITASLDYPGNKFVTIALDNVVFKHPIQSGQILCFSVRETKLGTSSVEYDVKVYGERDPDEQSTVLFQTSITFVNINDAGNKAPIERS